MESKTEINENLSNGRTTEINPDSPGGNSTRINRELSPAVNINAGTLLDDKYEIIKKLDVTSGEADLFLCRFEGKDYVAKIYRRDVSIKDDVIDVLKNVNSQFVARLHDAGTVNGKRFIITSYYKNGGIQGKTFTLADLKRFIIPCINEGLKALHDKGMIHKDIKPPNIMLDDDGTVDIIDFGISSVLEGENTVMVTETGKTPEYSAPETVRNLFLIESDYYSFGVTIYELFCGHTPYANMNADDIAKYVSVQKIPKPESMPDELYELISALTYYDVTNRKDKANINRRWTYDEVNKWLNGIVQQIPGTTAEPEESLKIPPYNIGGKRHTDLPSAVDAMALNWDDGKKHLFRGLMSNFFKSFNIEIASYCMDAEEEYNAGNNNEDVIFFKLLYRIYPELKAFYWKGARYGTLQILGNKLLYDFQSNNFRLNRENNFTLHDEILSNKLLSIYFELTRQSDKLKSMVSDIETMYTHSTDKHYVKFIASYMFSEKKIFKAGSEKFSSFYELVTYLKKLFDNSCEDFVKFCKNFIDTDNKLDTTFEAWLVLLGKKEEIRKWKAALNTKNDHAERNQKFTELRSTTNILTETAEMRLAANTFNSTLLRYISAGNFIDLLTYTDSQNADELNHIRNEINTAITDECEKYYTEIHKRIKEEQERQEREKEQKRQGIEQTRKHVAKFQACISIGGSRSYFSDDGCEVRPSGFTVGLKADGTVVAVGDKSFGQCDTAGWRDIVAVSAGRWHTVGLKADGTVVTAGDNFFGQCDTADWRDIVAVSAGTWHTVGLKADGTVIVAGDNDEGQCDTADWGDITAISAGRWHIVGLKTDGTVVAVSHSYFSQWNTVDWMGAGWIDIVAVSAGDLHTAGLKADGTVVAVGYNYFGQWNNADWMGADWIDIVAVSAGTWHTVGLKADGAVVAAGDNDFGQCDTAGWRDIVAVSAGDYFTVGLKADGTVVAVGDNDCGQCNTAGWVGIKPVSEELLLKRKQEDEILRLKQIEDEKRCMQQSGQWALQGLCRYCGGQFGGWFTKKCKSCGRAF